MIISPGNITDNVGSIKDAAVATIIKPSGHAMVLRIMDADRFTVIPGFVVVSEKVWSANA